MPELFSVLTAPAFERDFRKISKRNPILMDALEDLIAALREDPYSHSGQHRIKKTCRHETG
jgi:mRNA-degrading endonuclease YafQ of YafQ-DinJ toxin-antitoxin module